MNRVHVSWVQPFLIAAINLGLIFAQHDLPIADGWHKVIEIALVIVMFALIARWLWRNNGALEEAALQRDIERQAAERHVTLTPVQTHYLVAQERRAQEQAYGDV